MLPPPCRWIHDDAASYLQWHAGCVGSVKIRDGAWRITLQGWGVNQEHPCASRRQGVRFLERWVCGRGGLPGFGNKAEGRKRTAAALARRDAVMAQLWSLASRKMPVPVRYDRGSTLPPPEKGETQVYEWPSESP